MVSKKVIYFRWIKCELERICIFTVCKNVVDMFLVVTCNITPERINDIIKKAKCNFIEQNC